MVTKIKLPYIIIALLLIVIMFLLFMKTSNDKVDTSSDIILSKLSKIESVNKTLLSKDSVRVMEIGTILSLQEDLSTYYNSLQRDMAKLSNITKPIVAINKVDTFKSPAIYVPYTVRDTVAKQYDFDYDTKWVKFGGIVKEDGVYVKENGIIIPSEENILYGQRRKNIFSKWETTATFAQSNPFIYTKNATVIGSRNKERKWRPMVGIGTTYNITTNKLVFGPTFSFGYIF